MSKIAIFIDGGYMNRLLSDFGFRIKYDLFSNWIADNLDIFRVYFYDCLPYVNKRPYSTDPPTDAQKLALARKQNFFNLLNRLPNFEVRTGRLEPRGKDINGKNIYVQKRIDIMLGVDLTKLSLKNNIISHAAIVSGDSDFIPAIKLAKDEGVKIILVHGPKATCHEELWIEADERKEMTQSILANFRIQR